MMSLLFPLVMLVIVLLNMDSAYGGNCATAAACLNGGTCPTPLDSAVCTCTPGTFTGDTCADACTSAGGECLNSGTCDATTTPNSCTCAGGYLGLQCADACTTNTHCLNGGTCSATTPKTCTCAGTYTGLKCADACTAADTQCLNGGTCDATATPKACTCIGGHTGLQCASGGWTVTYMMPSLIISLLVSLSFS